MRDVKIQWRQSYGHKWKTVIGPHPEPGMALMHRLLTIHRANPEHHLACYIDGELNVAWMPNTGFGDTPEVTVNGVTYVPKN